MELKMISLKKIVTNPLQPRQEFDREKLQELANSIREGELLQPIVVRLNGGDYEIVCGERRFKAFQILKEPRIPAIVRDIKDDTDALEKSLIENLQRDDLTSVERENAIGSLWDSGRYKSGADLDRKLGYSEKHSTVSRLLQARDDRKKLALKADISTVTLHQTRVLEEEPRKKLLQQIADKKISTEDIGDVVRKVKEFPEPEQQIEILEEFEQQEDMSREIFDDIIKKKKEIIDGLREPEHIIEIESDSEKRILDDYYNIRNSVFDIDDEHINNFKSKDNKQKAITVLWDIHNFVRKKLVALGEIQEVDVD